MSAPYPLFNWFSSPRGITGAVIVALTAVLAGNYIASVYVAPLTPTYRPDFGSAQWIAPESAQAAGYFRKNLYVPEKVRHAWLLVTAPDSFTVYVNNRMIPGITPLAVQSNRTGALIPGAPTALVDLTSYLNVGTNTVAIYVMTSTYHYSARVMARGCIHYAMTSHDFVTDTSWRASSYPGVLDNLIQWTDPTVDDTHWPFAQAVDFPDAQFIQPVQVPDWLFEEPLKAHWISLFSPLPQQATFSTTFEAPGDARDSWIQISSMGKHRILVNGSPVADSAEQPDVVDSVRDTSVHFYWIQPWIKSGQNQIAVRVDDPREAPSLLAQISYRNSAGETTHVISNAVWSAQGAAGNQAPALDLGTYNYTGSASALGIPPRLADPSPYIASEYSHRFILKTILTLVLAAILLLIHLAIADHLVKKGARTPFHALALDAILHLPILLAWGVLELLSYDIHFQPEWSQNFNWVWLMLAVWGGLRWWAVRELQDPARQPEDSEPSWAAVEMTQGFSVALVCITVGAFLLRLAGIDLFTLDQDELLIRYASQGIWERGIPSLNNHGEVIRLTTYEALTYPMALCGLFFGWHEWSMRLPALLFGTFTAWNIGRMGRDLFSPLTGLLAALCYAILPWDVYFARHCIHPQQTQFFMLLCFWSFYRAIREPGYVEKDDYYKSCIYFVIGYLSWEGSAFVLPALAVMLFIMYPGKWQWMRQLHVYIGLFLVSVAVIAQLTSRGIKTPSYRLLGFGLTDLTPQAVFLNQTGTTAFYMKGILLEPCHLLLGLSMLFGFFFILKSPPLRYVILLFCTLLFAYSNFLPVYTNRYFYFYQSLLVLGGCASFCYVITALFDLARDQQVRLGRRVAVWSSGVALALLLLTSSTVGFRLLNISPTQDDPSTRYGLYWQEARPACEYVASHLRPGDYVAGNFNYSYYYINNKWVDFTLNQFLDQLSVFNINNGEYGAYENIYVRVRSYLNERDFVKTFSHCKRLWYIGFMASPTSPDFVTSINSYVANRSRIVYSGYNVNVYLAEGMPTKAGESIPDPALPPNGMPKLFNPTAQAGSLNTASHVNP